MLGRNSCPPASALYTYEGSALALLNIIGSASFLVGCVMSDDKCDDDVNFVQMECASLRALCDASSTFAWNDEGGHERTRVQVQVQASWVQAGDKKDFFRA